MAEIRDIGAHQKWYAFYVGNARAFTNAVKAAWRSGDYGSLSPHDRNALDAATAISEFDGGHLARVLDLTPPGQRGLTESLSWGRGWARSWPFWPPQSAR